MSSEDIAPAFENDTTLSFSHEVYFGKEDDYSLLIRQHPGNINYTEFVLLEDGKEDPLICFPSKDLGVVINALQMHQGNLKFAE